MKYFLAALFLMSSLATSATARTRMDMPQAAEIGREVAAPSWSAACMTDHGPTQCDEPMWVYGSPQVIARYRNAF
jgi:hypothetical protein